MFSGELLRFCDGNFEVEISAVVFFFSTAPAAWPPAFCRVVLLSEIDSVEFYFLTLPANLSGILFALLKEKLLPSSCSPLGAFKKW